MTPARPTGPGPAAPLGAIGHVVVVADGDVPARAALDGAWPGWDDGITAVIAADAGLARALAIGLQPTLLVGDMDSVDPHGLAQAEAAGLPIHRSPTDKDESDTELALVEAIRFGATRVTVLGTLGGRLDHALANVWLLAHPALAGIGVVLLDAGTRASLITAPGPDGRPVTRALPGAVGTTVSLLPMGGDAEGVTTAGFRYPLRGETLVFGPARGLSNVRARDDASVTLRRGRLLVVETAPKTGNAAGGLSSRS